MNVELARPWALALLLLVPVWLLLARRGDGRGLTFARGAGVAGLRRRGRVWLGALPNVLRALAVAALVIALAGPRTGETAVETRSEGIAIMLAIDISSSMLSQDFRPANRLEVARRTVSDFVRGRPNDRIGLVAFAGEALTQVPTTVDYPILQRFISDLRVGQLQDGTAIGMGLATAVNRLRRAPGKSKVIILMSDGENTDGTVDPRDAAKAAAAYGIRVYTVGVGSVGSAITPVGYLPGGRVRYAYVPVRIDEPLMRDIARTTGGRYFRATDAGKLRQIYGEIDRLVKTPVDVKRYLRFREHYLPFVLAAAALLVAEWLLRGSRWGRVP